MVPESLLTQESKEHSPETQGELPFASYFVLCLKTGHGWDEASL